jgi:hypothetical protein
VPRTAKPSSTHITAHRRSRRRLKIGFAVVAAVALSASACGGEARLTKAQYQQSVTQIGEQLTNTLTKTFSSPQLQNPDSLKEAASVIRQGQKNLRDAAKRLRDLNPPEQIQTLHDQFVRGLEHFARDFGSFAQVTEKGDVAALQRFSQQISDQTLPSMVEIKGAIDGMKAKGYDISNG